MVVRKDTFAHERRRDRYVEALGETNQRFSSVITDGAVSREENRSFRCSENFGSPGNLSGRRRGIAHYIDFERMMPRRHGHFFDILWEGEVDSTRTLSLRHLERFPNHLGHSLWSRDQLSPFCNRFEHADQIDYLVGFFVDPV